ncbi:MAG: phosphodiester glycosidase family protein [Phycisphaerae bacterium]
MRRSTDPAPTATAQIPSFLLPGVLTAIVSAALAAAQPAAAPANAPATQPSTRPATTQPRESVADAAARARAWIDQPAERAKLAGFAPAAEIELRIYGSPKPQRVWIARVDLSAPGVRVAVTEPAVFTGEEAKFETRCATTLDFARQRGVQLAFNASAFAPFRPKTGDPMSVSGLAATNGRVYSEADASNGAMYISRDGRLALKGPALDRDGVWHVVPGFRMLLDDGRIAVNDKEHNSNFGNINPRTAVGTDRDGKTLWIVVADGRQPATATGMTLVEVACLFEALGAWDALNLDGGGSSTLVTETAGGAHRVLNTPVGQRAPGSLRQVANNVGLYIPGRALDEPPPPVRTLRDAVIRTALSSAPGSDMQLVEYAGQRLLSSAGPNVLSCSPSLPLFLDAYGLWKHTRLAAELRGRWFDDWPPEKFQAFLFAWCGINRAAPDADMPAGIRADAPTRRAQAALRFADLAADTTDPRQLQRGDFVHVRRLDGSDETVIFWGRDFADDGRERLWYVADQPRDGRRIELARATSPTAPGSSRRVVTWEVIGDEIDPAAIFGARLRD